MLAKQMRKQQELQAIENGGKKQVAEGGPAKPETEKTVEIKKRRRDRQREGRSKDREGRTKDIDGKAARR